MKMPVCVRWLGVFVCCLPNTIADPLNITSVSRTPTGHFVIIGNTIYPTGNLIVQASADLGISFAPLGLVTATGGAGFQYDDAAATALQRRFYHLVHPTTGGVCDVQPASVTFGPACCGNTAAAQTITISNPGSNRFTFVARMTSGAEYYTLSAAGGSVDPGGSFILTITPQAIPEVSATSPDLYGGQLTISTSILDDPAHVIALHQTARGARLSMEPISLVFGNVFPGSAKTLQIGVVNSGNVPVQVTLTSSNPVFTAAPNSATVNAGQNAPISVTFRPTQFGRQTGTLTLSVSGGACLCAPLPPGVSLQGN